MKAFFWTLAILGALIGLLILLFGLPTANGAPQEASISAIAIACAVIPYCLARGVTEIMSK